MFPDAPSPPSAASALSS